jgi:hypothetical protein
MGLGNIVLSIDGKDDAGDGQVTLMAVSCGGPTKASRQK